MMRRLRRLANRKGSSVEDVIREALEQFVVKCEAERELDTKIIRFPKPLGANSSNKEECVAR
jgi:hypothetical protein